jgi:ATP-dependent RNA helicase DDX54/DBP10
MAPKKHEKKAEESRQDDESDAGSAIETEQKYDFENEESDASSDNDTDVDMAEHTAETKSIHAATAAANRKRKQSGGFQSMGLSPTVFNAIIKKGYKVPTPIQRKTIPIIMSGRDIVAMARTGSGKTAAFIVPMLEKLKCHSAIVGARCLILAPSRELALQTMKFCQDLGRYSDLRCALVVGGDNMDEQFTQMAANPDMFVYWLTIL